MKLMRTVITILLLLFVGATVGTLIAQEVARPDAQPITVNTASPTVEAPIIPTNGQTSSDASASPIELPEVDDEDLAEGETSEGSEVGEPATERGEPMADASCVIEAVYFHNTHRCVTCLKIEGDAKAIVEEVFAEELAEGTLRWSAVNMEDNPSQSVEYGLAAPSLVLLRKSGGQITEWVLLAETWALVRSTTRYSAYIIDSFQAFLEGCL